jgi:uncharacterized protein YegJ (DUF2314 family)
MPKSLVIWIAIFAVGVVALLLKPKETESQRWEREQNMSTPGEDPRFRAAEDEARRRWPEFVAAFAKRKPGDNFAVKAQFVDGGHTEWMWVQVHSIDGATLRGTLDNEPVYVKNVKGGQSVTVKQADTDDWLFQRQGDKDMTGAFTAKAMIEIERERKAKTK